MRIAVASFSHETCTFCSKPTTVEDFEAGGVLHGEEVLEASRGIPSYINGYIKAAEEHDDCTYTLTGPMSRGAKRNLGVSAVLGFGESNHVVITPTLHQVLDDAIFHAVGLTSRTST